MCVVSSLREDSSPREHYPFPCKERLYDKRAGAFLVTILRERFSELGFGVSVNPLEENGVDLKVFREGKLVLVAEVLNWNISSILTEKRERKITENLNEYNCLRVLIHTVPLPQLNEFSENGILLLPIGYQVLPRHYFSFFKRRGQIERRKPYSKKVIKDITRLIFNLLKEAGITCTIH